MGSRQFNKVTTACIYGTDSLSAAMPCGGDNGRNFKTMPRQMTPAEKQRFHALFPNINVNAAVVTDGSSIVYNCISWALGYTDRWIWPGPTLQQFDALYRKFGFVRAGNGAIAAWGQSTSAMTHGCVAGSLHGPRWESKCGSDLRIQHGLNELVGASYGRVVAFYAKSVSLAAESDILVAEVAKDSSASFSMNADIQTAIKNAVADVPQETRGSFANAFDAWKKTWFEGGAAINSDPHTRACGKEFDALISLGPSIIPLVVEALSVPDNFIAMQLYDAIQPDANLVIQYDSDDDRILEGEQGRARRVVQHWLASR